MPNLAVVRPPYGSHQPTPSKLCPSACIKVDIRREGIFLGQSLDCVARAERQDSERALPGDEELSSTDASEFCQIGILYYYQTRVITMAIY